MNMTAKHQKMKIIVKTKQSYCKKSFVSFSLICVSKPAHWFVCVSLPAPAPAGDGHSPAFSYVWPSFTKTTLNTIPTGKTVCCLEKPPSEDAIMFRIIMIIIIIIIIIVVVLVLNGLVLCLNKHSLLQKEALKKCVFFNILKSEILRTQTSECLSGCHFQSCWFSWGAN